MKRNILKILFFAFTPTPVLAAAEPSWLPGITIGGYAEGSGEKGGEVSLLGAFMPPKDQKEMGQMGLLGLAGLAYGGAGATRYGEVEVGASVMAMGGMMIGHGLRDEEGEKGRQTTISAWLFEPIFFCREIRMNGRVERQFGAMLKVPLFDLRFTKNETATPK